MTDELRHVCAAPVTVRATLADTTAVAVNDDILKGTTVKALRKVVITNLETDKDLKVSWSASAAAHASVFRTIKGSASGVASYTFEAPEGSCWLTNASTQLFVQAGSNGVTYEVTYWYVDTPWEAARGTAI